MCCLPESNLFGPLNVPNFNGKIITMTVEEYETIRLIDAEGFTQEECAMQMNIARTTVQHIYNTARKELADSLVNGSVLSIEGGNYKLCDELKKTCGCGGCPRLRFTEDLIEDDDGGE